MICKGRWCDLQGEVVVIVHNTSLFDDIERMPGEIRSLCHQPHAIHGIQKGKAMKWCSQTSVILNATDVNKKLKM